MTFTEFQDAAERLAKEFEPCLVTTEVGINRHSGQSRTVEFTAGVFTGGRGVALQVHGPSAEECLDKLQRKLSPELAAEDAERRLSLLGELPEVVS